jgi:hypothetical protein
MIENKYSYQYDLIDTKTQMVVRTVAFDATFTLERMQMKLESEKQMYMRANGINPRTKNRYQWR